MKDTICRKSVHTDRLTDKRLTSVCFELTGEIVAIDLLRGAIVNRTYGIHKNLYILPFLLTIFDPINYGPPVLLIIKRPDQICTNMTNSMHFRIAL